MLNISPLMEACFLLLPTIMGTLKNTRQVPQSTRWITRLEDCLCTRPCKQEERMAWSTFLLLTNISLLWLIITMDRNSPAGFYSLSMEWKAVCRLSEIVNKRSKPIQVLQDIRGKLSRGSQPL